MHTFFRTAALTAATTVLLIGAVTMPVSAEEVGTPTVTIDQLMPSTNTTPTLTGTFAFIEGFNGLPSVGLLTNDFVADPASGVANSLPVTETSNGYTAGDVNADWRVIMAPLPVGHHFLYAVMCPTASTCDYAITAIDILPAEAHQTAAPTPAAPAINALPLNTLTIGSLSLLMGAVVVAGALLHRHRRRK